MSKKLLKSDEYDPIFNRLIDLCDAKNISVSNLLDMFTTSRSAIGAWKKGNISANIIPKIAEYFNITTDYLLTGVVLKKEYITVENNQKNFSENEQEMLAIFNQFADREQIKIIGKLEEWFAEKQRRAVAAQNQANIQTAYVAARSSDNHPPKTVIGNFSDIENAPDVTDEY